MNMKMLFLQCLLSFGFLYPLSSDGSIKVSANTLAAEDPLPLENPMSVTYLQRNLSNKSPRLILSPRIERQLKKKLKSDPMVSNVYRAFQLNAVQILQEDLLERIKIGRRLLSVSRQMLYRMNVLSMVYLIDGEEAVRQRINDEILAVCNFSDWNPSHYLDVAEMSLAVALAIDWVGDDLPKSTVNLAKETLIQKGIMPSYNESGNVGWIDNNNNWNQVCHAGMIAAAIVTADVDPDLSSRTLSRALDGIPHALEEYGPDGVYPEGSTYWNYGTSFTAMTSSMLNTAFDTDFGISNYPALKESAVFRILSVAPSGGYYNFADCGDRRSPNGDMVLAWFAAETSNAMFLEKERFLKDAAVMGQLPRFAGAGLIWLSQFEEEENTQAPLNWRGDGSNPVVFFRSGDERDYYFGGKGGRGTVNHGNMDAGSFIFELDGVRWVVDPGNQSYHNLEKTGFNLWGRCQECERWTLLTKNNYGHSTLTVNNKLHVVDGYSSISDFQKGDTPEATIDLSPTFGDDLASASRRFVKENDHSLLIEDRFTISDNTENIVWQLMTTADVEITDDGAMLRQDGKSLKLENLSHPELEISVVQLDPPPLRLDRIIDDLKRIEIRMPAYIFSDEVQTLRVRLSGEER